MNADDTQATGTVAPEDTTATDTAATQPSEASVQSNEAPDATPVVEATSEVKAEDTVEEKLLAGKYKTVDDLEKSYTELQSRFSKETSEKAELARILNDAFVAPENQGQAQVADTSNDYSDEPDPRDQKLEKLERQTAVSSFIMTHPDAAGDTMNKILAEDPVISQISGHEAKLEYAYLKSKNMTTQKAIEEARKQATQQTHAKIAEKQTAQVESAGTTVQTDENTELRNKATGNYNQADRDAARKSWIRKNLVNLN